MPIGVSHHTCYCTMNNSNSLLLYFHCRIQRHAAVFERLMRQRRSKLYKHLVSGKYKI